MNSILVDIDDTLIDTIQRTQAIMEMVLGCKIMPQDMEILPSQHIFEKYATPDQKARVNELRDLYMDTLLCRNDTGVDLLKLDVPIPFAASTLQAWNDFCKIIYLTGRTEKIREQTTSILEKSGFPIENSQLIMFKPEDWKPKASLLEARTKQVSSICSANSVIRVVDDFPGYFIAYKQLSIPERIGFCHKKLYSARDYIERGATKVVEGWIQLKEDLPDGL